MPLTDTDTPPHSTVPRAENRENFVEGSRGRAIAELLRGVHDRDILMLMTGAADVGKSTVLHEALLALAAEPIRVIRLVDPGEPIWSLAALTGQLLGEPAGILTDDGVAAAVTELTVAMEPGDRIVIAVDGAQSLTDEAMEFLLLLASPVRGRATVPQIILVGRGDFWKRQWRDELQMITSLAECVTIAPFAGGDGSRYIAWCLERITRNGSHRITPDAVTEILRHSGGMPDKIASVLAASIRIAACRHDRTVTADVVDAAISSSVPTPIVRDSATSSLKTAPFDDEARSAELGRRARTVGARAPSHVVAPAEEMPAMTRLRLTSPGVALANVPMVAPFDGVSTGIVKPNLYYLSAVYGLKRSVRARATVGAMIVAGALAVILPREHVIRRAADAIGWLQENGATQLARVFRDGSIGASASPGPRSDSKTFDDSRTSSRSSSDAALRLSDVANEGRTVLAVGGDIPNFGARPSGETALSALQPGAAPLGLGATVTVTDFASRMPKEAGGSDVVATSVAPDTDGKHAAATLTPPAPSNSVPAASALAVADVPTSLNKEQKTEAGIETPEEATATAPTPAISSAGESTADLARSLATTGPAAVLSALPPAMKESAPSAEPAVATPASVPRSLDDVQATATERAAPWPAVQTPLGLNAPAPAAVSATSPAPAPSQAENIVPVPSAEPSASPTSVQPRLARDLPDPVVELAASSSVETKSANGDSGPPIESSAPSKVLAPLAKPLSEPAVEQAASSSAQTSPANVDPGTSPGTFGEVSTPSSPARRQAAGSAPEPVDDPGALSRATQTPPDATLTAAAQETKVALVTGQPANATVALPTPAASRTVTAKPLPPEVVASLLRRASAALDQGDVLAARLFYERAAAAGSGAGATGAGKTYDPGYLATIQAVGLRGDAARAAEWYRVGANELGSAEAAERLRKLTGP